MNRVDMGNLPAVVCIVVSWTHFIGVTQRTYEVCISPRARDRRVISPKEAKAIIADRGLIKVYESSIGYIYDTPDKDFYNKYHGWHGRYEE